MNGVSSKKAVCLNGLINARAITCNIKYCAYQLGIAAPSTAFVAHEIINYSRCMQQRFLFAEDLVTKPGSESFYGHD